MGPAVFLLYTNIVNVRILQYLYETNITYRYELLLCDGRATSESQTSW